MVNTMKNASSELVLLNEEVLRSPRPLDEEIAKSIAIKGLFCEMQQRAVADRLQSAFDALRADKTAEHGDCIALSLGHLAIETEDEIDTHMTEVADQQNHGMSRMNHDLVAKELGVDIIWSGFDPGNEKIIKLYKRTGPIVLADYSVSTGTLWALKARTGVSYVD